MVTYINPAEQADHEAREEALSELRAANDELVALRDSQDAFAVRRAAERAEAAAVRIRWLMEYA